MQNGRLFQETGVLARKIVTSSTGSMPSISSKTQVSCSFKLLPCTKSLQPDDSIFGQFDWMSNNFARQVLPLETRKFTMVSSSLRYFLKKLTGVSCKFRNRYSFIGFFIILPEEKKRGTSPLRTIGLDIYQKPMNATSLYLTTYQLEVSGDTSRQHRNSEMWIEESIPIVLLWG